MADETNGKGVSSWEEVEQDATPVTSWEDTDVQKKSPIANASSQPVSQRTAPLSESSPTNYSWSGGDLGQQVIGGVEDVRTAHNTINTRAIENSKLVTKAKKELDEADKDYNATANAIKLQDEFATTFEGLSQNTRYDAATNTYMPPNAFAMDAEGKMQPNYSEEYLKDFDKRMKSAVASNITATPEQQQAQFKEKQAKAIEAQNKYNATAEQLTKDIESLKAIKTKEMGEYGIDDAFMNGMAQTNAAITIALKAGALDSTQLEDELERIYVQQLSQPESKNGIGYQAVEMIGGQVAPILATTGASFAIGGLGTVAVATSMYGTMGYGNNLMQGYIQSRQQGMNPNESLAKAQQFARVGAATGAIEGSLAAINPFMKAGGLTNKTLTQGVKTALTDAGIDGAVAMGMQLANNKYGQSIGFDIEDTDGVLEQGAGEVAFSLGINALFGGTAKLKPQVHDMLVRGLAKSDVASLQTVVDKAVSEGVIDAARGTNTMKQIINTKQAYDKIPDEVGEDIKEEVLPDMMRKVELEKQLDAKDDAFKPAIEAEIETVNRKIQEDTGAPLAIKEQKAYEALQSRKGDSEKPLTPSEKSDLKHFEKREKKAVKLSEKKAKEAEKIEAEAEVEVEPQEQVEVTEQVSTETPIADEQITIPSETTDATTEGATVEAVDAATPDNAEVQGTADNTEVATTATEDVGMDIPVEETAVAETTEQPAEVVVPIVEQTEQVGVGDTISFLHAGNKVSGKVNGVEGGKYKVKGRDGTNYKVSDIDIIPASKDASQTAKVYEQIAGLAPNKNTGRIPVAPITGKTPKQLSDILFDVSKGAKQRVFFAKPSRNRAIGTYSPGDTAIKIRYSGDLDATAHELGHSIDDHFGLLSDLQNTSNAPVEAELMQLAKFGSKPPKGHANPKMYKLGEGFAEWLRAYIANPDEAKRIAPNTYDMYNSKVDADYKKAVSAFSDDFRTFAGASGRDMVLSNVQWQSDKNKNLIGEIFDRSDNENMFSVTWADRLSAKFINPFKAFNKANEYLMGIRGIDELKPQDDPEILSRALLRIDGKVSEILESGMIDSELNLLKDKDGNAKNLKWLLEPLDNTDQNSIENDVKDVAAYMIAERTVELSNKFDRESVLTGIGGGIFKDVDVAQKTLDEFNNGDPNRLQRIKEAAARYRELSNDVLQYMVDKGRMNKKQYDAIKKNNVQYVALQRVVEAEPNQEIQVFKGGGSGALGTKADVVRSIKGSTRKIENPYTSLMDTIYKGVKEADRNDALLAFRDLLVNDRGMYEGDTKRIADVGTVVTAGEKNSIPIFVDGVPEHWRFQEDIYRALKGIDSDGYKLPLFVTALPKLLRASVTNFPVFAVKNVVRDLQDRMIKSNDNSWRNAFGVANLFGKAEHWNELARAGGLGAGVYMKDKAHYDGLLQVAMRDLAKDKNNILLDGDAFKRGWEGYKSILSKSETANRVAEYRSAYKNAKEKGMDDYNAKLYGAYQSADLLDFAVMGDWMKVINQIVPFSNAAVQSLRSTAVRAKQNPIGFASRVLLMSVMPNILEWLFNHRSEEVSKEYEELPSWQRDMFYNFKVGDNTWIRIPKHFELSLSGSASSRMMSFANGVEDAFEGFAGSMAKTLLPIDESVAGGPYQKIMEGFANYDFFRDKNIIPPNEEGLDLALRKTGRASRLGKALQEVAGIDARKIDHFIKGTASYFGNTALKLSNIGREGTSAEKFNLGDLGFFAQTPAYNSKTVQKYLQEVEALGLKNKREYKEFKSLAEEYFNAPDGKSKDEAAKTLIEYAEYELKDLEYVREELLGEDSE